MKNALIAGLLLCGSLILHAKEDTSLLKTGILYDKDGSYVRLERPTPTHVDLSEIYGKNTPKKLLWGTLAGLTACASANYYYGGYARTTLSSISPSTYYSLAGLLMALSSYKWYNALCDEHIAADEAREVVRGIYTAINSQEPPLESFSITQEMYSLAGLYVEQHTKNIDLIVDPRSLVISFTQQKGE